MNLVESWISPNMMNIFNRKEIPPNMMSALKREYRSVDEMREAVDDYRSFFISCIDEENEIPKDMLDDYYKVKDMLLSIELPGLAGRENPGKYCQANL